ncbi:MAG: carboxypeptidase-like regulatory domain-containing protein [Nodosilinea sp.]
MNARLFLPLVLGGSLGWASAAQAHGVAIDYQVAQGIALEARYDSGEPMQEAQVIVYAPDNPAEPWLRGTTDAEGRFWFSPDSSLPGNWEVAVRQAGHGEILTIPVGGDAAAGGVLPVGVASQGGELPPVQQGLTMAAVIWGFVGTALFFARGKR